MVTHVESDILEYEVKWNLGNVATKKKKEEEEEEEERKKENKN